MAEKIVVAFEANGAAVEVRLTEDALRLIRKEALASIDKETGGILIGRYESDGNLAVVTAATESPGDSSSGRAWFQRGMKGLTAKLRARWPHGEYYLGEWHSHPGGAPDPSSDDIRGMRSISIDISYKCPKPIMIIAGTSGTSIRISVSVLENGRLLRLRPRVPPTGSGTDRSIIPGSKIKGDL
ncbi:Mov34/MPN/PAD-1 family protein [Ensifer adhaerens]|uniref:Mov34/MPN/PAD-1 family protein n=1 Tax=Ensifer adhaerens TaxID=106592 RepID=UPI00098E8F47|nr:Mov34/MPN/PAD-1 family protein [Ensifer adhaerens]